MKTILAVDDDEYILDSLHLALSKEGYHTLLASNAHAAEHTVKKALPDLVVLDLKLPDSPGTDVVKMMKENSKTKNIPVIIISANIDAKYAAVKAGADAFIEKPFDIYHLTSTVKKHIQS